MLIGILGTGTLATALAAGWRTAGHDILVGGRSTDKARTLAAAVQGRAASPREVAGTADAVLLAVRWSGVDAMLEAAGAAVGSLAGTALIDPSNAVEHGAGELLTPPGRSAAEHVAAAAPGAHVVKAFHLFPAATWTRGAAPPERPAVAICGDHGDALATVGALVRDVGGEPVTVGPLARARQLEEAAGFVMALALAGADPQAAVPHVPRAVTAPSSRG